jgi:hypothetical protein
VKEEVKEEEEMEEEVVVVEEMEEEEVVVVEEEEEDEKEEFLGEEVGAADTSICGVPIFFLQLSACKPRIIACFAYCYWRVSIAFSPRSAARRHARKIGGKLGGIANQTIFWLTEKTRCCACGAHLS